MECWIIILKMLLIYRNKFSFCTQLNSCASLVVQTVKSLPALRVWSLGWEDALEKEMATHSSILAWKIPRTRSLAGYNPWSHKESDTTERLYMYRLKNFNKLSGIFFWIFCGCNPANEDSSVALFSTCVPFLSLALLCWLVPPTTIFS